MFLINIYSLINLIAFPDFEIEARPQVYIRVCILNAIVHFELNNYSLIPAIVKQVQKINTTLLVLIPIEEKILQALLKISTAKKLTKKQELSFLHNVSAETSDLNKLNKTAINSLFGNYDKWLTAKIKRKQVYEIYK